MQNTFTKFKNINIGYILHYSIIIIICIVVVVIMWLTTPVVMLKV